MLKQLRPKIMHFLLLNEFAKCTTLQVISYKNTSLPLQVQGWNPAIICIYFYTTEPTKACSFSSNYASIKFKNIHNPVSHSLVLVQVFLYCSDGFPRPQTENKTSAFKLFTHVEVKINCMYVSCCISFSIQVLRLLALLAEQALI